MGNNVDARGDDALGRASTVLAALVLVAIAVSVVHYADNFFNYDAFPVATSGPMPSRTVVGASWFGFTALAVLALVLLYRRRLRAAAVFLALYSGSGLVGIGHYTVPGAIDMPWWRQAHVAADILCGIAILLFAVWIVRRAPPANGHRELHHGSGSAGGAGPMTR